MNPAPMRSFRSPRTTAGVGVPLDLSRKAEVCGKVLAEARKLSSASQFGALPNQLVRRVAELLDDMDEILVALDPVGNRPSFAIAAALHREFEQVEATITDLRKGRVISRNAPARC